MNLPDWVRPDVKPADITIPDSIRTAPGWRLYGPPHYTCVPPPDGPFCDPVALREIHVFDPGVIPMWEIQGYLPPHSTSVTYTKRLHLARHVRDPSEIPPQRFRVTMPTHARHPRPNSLDYACFVEDHPEGGPSTVIPADGRVYRDMRASFAANKAEALARFDQYVERLHAKLEKAHRDNAEEQQYIQKQLWKTIGPTVQQWTDRDWAGYRAWIRRRMASRRRLGVMSNSTFVMRRDHADAAAV